MINKSPKAGDHVLYHHPGGTVYWGYMVEVSYSKKYKYNASLHFPFVMEEYLNGGDIGYFEVLPVDMYDLGELE